MAEYLKPEEEIERLSKIIYENPEDVEVYFKRGYAYYNLKRYNEAIQDYNKAIGLEPNDPVLYINRGSAFYYQKQYDKAVQDYNTAIELNSNYTDAYFNRGSAFQEQKQYDKAIQDYNRVIELEPNHANVYISRGNVFYNLTQYNKAIQEYNRAIELNPNLALAYNNRGSAFQEQKQYDKAIQDYNTAIELNSNYTDAYFNRAKAFQEQKQHNEAILDYSEAIKLNPDDSSAYNNRGNVFSELGQYKEAIQDYNRVIERDPLFIFSYNNRGIAFLKQRQYDKAIQDYNEAIKLDSNYNIAYYNRGEAFLFKNEWKKAAESFNAANKDILDILSTFGGIEQIEEVVSSMIDLNKNDFFNKTINSINGNQDNYKKLYIKVLQIIALLHVKDETTAAHYTKRATATQLFFECKLFRLNSTITANDPQEGKTLLKFFNIKESDIEESQKNELKTDYQAFIGCFTFNHESLNQFRLYGKEADKEATGVSLVLNKNFFNEKMDIGLLSDCYLKDDDKESSDIKDTQSQKYALYRCIYIDPKTHKVISLGHKEEYSFYREDSNVSLDVITKYNEGIDKIKNDVNNYLIKLDESIIANQDLDKDIICELLLPLRYLVKHVAYKEEQECRIFDIKDLQEEKLKEKDKKEIKFTPDYTQMYIEYQPITDYIKKVIFAPKTEGVEIFMKAAGQEGLEVDCEVSTHPFS